MTVAAVRIALEVAEAMHLDCKPARHWKQTHGNLTVHNNTLHRFARVSRTVRVGVSWTGCGNTVSHNEVFDAPQIGIIGHGVNMIFEDNDLHDLAKGTADTGGFYAGRSWADRGNVVRRNKFRRFYQVEKMAQSTSVNGM